MKVIYHENVKIFIFLNIRRPVLHMFSDLCFYSKCPIVKLVMPVRGQNTTI
jgi:hypothetical protein